MASFFRGTSTTQDSRFSNKEKKLYSSLKFPLNFSTKVDMDRVNMDVMRMWVAKKISELLGFDDEVVIEMAYEHLQEKNPDPKVIHVSLMGFLEEKTSQFTLELWTLLLSAQESMGGIPQRFIDEKKEEILRARIQESLNIEQFKERQQQHTAIAEGQYLPIETSAVPFLKSHKKSPSRTTPSSRPRRKSRSRSRSRPRFRSRSRSRSPSRSHRLSRRTSRSPNRHRERKSSRGRSPHQRQHRSDHNRSDVRRRHDR